VVFKTHPDLVVGVDIGFPTGEYNVITSDRVLAAHPACPAP
jgi:hypothetical protein